MRALAPACAALLLAACSSMELPGMGSNVYERQAAAVRAYESGEDAQAEALYLGLIRQVPNDPENLLRLGNLYARSGRPDLAADTYQQALLFARRDDRLWYNLGIIRERQAHAALIEAYALMAEDDVRRKRIDRLATCLAPMRDERPPATQSTQAPAADVPASP